MFGRNDAYLPHLACLMREGPRRVTSWGRQSALVGAMKIQISTPVGVMLAMLIVSGCSNGYYVDQAQTSRYSAMAQDEPVQVARAPRATPEVATVRSNLGRESLALANARAGGVVLNDAAPTGSINRDGSVGKLWPKRGTVEWDELQAEETARENRISDVMRSICRGC